MRVECREWLINHPQYTVGGDRTPSRLSLRAAHGSGRPASAPWVGTGATDRSWFSLEPFCQLPEAASGFIGGYSCLRPLLHQLGCPDQHVESVEVQHPLLERRGVDHGPRRTAREDDDAKAALPKLLRALHRGLAALDHVGQEGNAVRSVMRARVSSTSAQVVRPAPEQPSRVEAMDAPERYNASEHTSRPQGIQRIGRPTRHFAARTRAPPRRPGVCQSACAEAVFLQPAHR